MMRLLPFALVLFASTADAQRPRPFGGHPVRPDFGLAQAVWGACEDVMEGRDNERRCISIASASRNREIVSLIKSCESAMEGDENELACIGLGASSRRLRADAITACEDAMEGDANELACIRTMAGSWLATTAITACEDAMEGDTNELRCLEAVVGTRYEPAELVRFCDEHEAGDDAELACIANWR